MANFPMLLTLSIIMLLPTIQAITSTAVKDQVPCTMCAECENPCQPSPPPPVIECPPPPSPPPPLPPPPAVIPECPPPPPKPTCSPCETLPPPEPPCENSACLPSLVPPPPYFPWMPPQSQYLSPDQPYFPPGPPRPSYLPWTPFPAEYSAARNVHALWNNSLLLCLLHISLVLIYCGSS